MNDTNRGANRLVLIVTGLIALVLGLAGVLLGIPGPVRSGWRSSAGDVARNVDDAIDVSRIPGSTATWYGIAFAVLMLVVVVLLLVFILRQGHGRTRRLIRTQPDENGASIVDAAFAEEALQAALGERSDLVASSVTTYAVKATPVLKISVTCRRGASPRTVAEDVDETLAALDSLLGHDADAFVQIGGGFRARTAATSRVD